MPLLENVSISISSARFMSHDPSAFRAPMPWPVTRFLDDEPVAFAKRPVPPSIVPVCCTLKVAECPTRERPNASRDKAAAPVRDP